MVSLQSLEAELKKMQVANKDSIERFDENLKRLAEKKLKSEVAIYQVIVSVCTFVLFWSSFGRLLRRLPVSPCVQFTPQERLKIGFLINSVLQENKMRQRHEELRLQREKMTAHMVRRPQTRRQKNLYDWLSAQPSERNRRSFQFQLERRPFLCKS